jgi:cellulose biosynthesis protein BcsQ
MIGRIFRKWLRTISGTFSRTKSSRQRFRVPRSIRLAEAPSHGKPIILYDVRSRGAESYIKLAKEILEKNHRQPLPSSPAPE